MFFTSNLFSLVISILVTLPATGDYGTWILVGTLAPFYIYLIFWYKTDFLKSQHEGLFGSFNPLPIKSNEKQEKEEKDDPVSVITTDEIKDPDVTQVDIMENEAKNDKIKLI